MHVIFLQKKASCIRLLNKTGQVKSHAELRVRMSANEGRAYLQGDQARFGYLNALSRPSKNAHAMFVLSVMVTFIPGCCIPCRGCSLFAARG